MVLSRGVVHVEVMPSGCKLDGDGLSSSVHKLLEVLRKMFGPEARLPRNVFTDRGTGMCIPNGTVVDKYSEAIADNGFQLYWDVDAHRQSPDIGDILSQETAVSWFRRLMKTRSLSCLHLRRRLRSGQSARLVTRTITRNYDVASLCAEFPSRLSEVVDREGDRLLKW